MIPIVIVPTVVRHSFAMHHRPWADQLGLPLRLTADTAAAMGVAWLPPPEDKPVVALSFDDGPHPEGTPAILEILAAHQTRAIFFVVGEQVVQRPQLLQRMVDEGHRVALHGYQHLLHLRHSPVQIEDDFTRGLAAIEDAIGLTPNLHRPPYGIYSPWSLRIARERGLQPLLWARWGKDWRKFTTPERIARRATAGARAGDVILLHDADFYSAGRSHERTAAALPHVLARLQSAGLGSF